MMRQDDIDYEDLEPIGTEVDSQDLPEDEGIESPVEGDCPALNEVDKPCSAEASRSSSQASLELKNMLDDIDGYLSEITELSVAVMENCNNIGRDFEKVLRKDEFTGDLMQIMARTDHRTLIRRMSEYISTLKSSFSGAQGEIKQIRSNVAITQKWITLITKTTENIGREE